MASALDQSIIDLCGRHNLASASVTFMRNEGRGWFYGSVQWIDESCKHRRNIATCDSDSFTHALSGAVAKMLTMRGDITIPTDALELAA